MSTREEWLNAAAVRLNEMIAEHTDLTPSKKVLISAGWPRRDRGGKVIGQCFPKITGEGAHHVFISPTLSTATAVLPVLLHELVHAADDCGVESGKPHGKVFTKAIRALGLEGKPTATVPGKELRATLKALAGELGKYPSTRLNPSQYSKPQTTRMLKVSCPECGCVVRMTRKWLDDAGAPTCACGVQMEEA